MCMVLVSAGVTSIANSFARGREELVQDYDGSVEYWIGEGRSVFAGSGHRVEAMVMSPNSSHVADLQAANTSEPSFQDAEQDRGLLSYTPLRFEADVMLDSYYSQNETADTSQSLWRMLPAHDEATKVVFRFSMRNASGHVSTFSTKPLPLVYDEIVRPRTPAPESKCRREQKGVWRDRHCHVVKRLLEVCIQVGLSPAGEWRPHSKKIRLEGNASARYRQSKRHGSHSVDAAAETYGCDPNMAWHPATWKIDPCWGTRSAVGTPGKCSLASTSPHRISIVVRSAQDPYIRAEELTKDSFNFGLSTSSQVVFGTTLLIVGLVLGVLPCLRICEVCRERRRNWGDDAVSLKYGNAQEASFGRGETVYGSRSL